MKHTTLALLVILLSQACGVALNDGLATPPDEYCFPGLCNTDQICMAGECFDPCESDANCGSGCCANASDGKAYCAPSSTEVCQ